MFLNGGNFLFLFDPYEIGLDWLKKLNLNKKSLFLNGQMKDNKDIITKYINDDCMIVAQIQT